MVEILFGHHGHVEEPVTQQTKALSRSAESGNDSARRMLLKAGAGVEGRDDQQSTPPQYVSTETVVSVPPSIVGYNINLTRQY